MTDETKSTTPPPAPAPATAPFGSGFNPPGSRVAADPRSPAQKERAEKLSKEQDESHKRLDGDPRKVRMAKDAVVETPEGDFVDASAGEVVEMRHQKAFDAIRHGAAKAVDKDESLGKAPAGKRDAEKPDFDKRKPGDMGDVANPPGASGLGSGETK
ncbi:MAG: hypothetical protein M3167_06340 [Acidobacteriota bacterium]|nr:hypothetical protein [Acidobacteriota bacterium]MDQ6892283.1 hypothetical protein [Acidobacteriota bacterium]